jgi:hypothetical protein
MRRTTSRFLLLAALFASTPALLQAQAAEGRASDIEIGGRLQTQYAASSVDGTDADFFFRRARVLVDFGLTDQLEGRVQTEFEGGEAQLKDAYLRLTLSPAFRVSVGQFKRAFDLFELSSSTDLSIIERDGRVDGVSGCAGVGGLCSYSRLTEKLAFADRDQGIKVDGHQGRVSWLATVTNGTGANTPDENGAKSFSGRLSLSLSDKVTVSGNLASHDYLGLDDQTERANAWAADVEYGGWRDGLHLEAAVTGGDNWKALYDSGDAPVFFAFQGMASVFLPTSSDLFTAVEPVARLSVADPDTGMDDDGGLVFTPGLMFYFVGKNKVGLNVDVWSPQAGDTEYSLKLQTFLYF